MCWSPKIKIPKVNMPAAPQNIQAPPPATPIATPKGVEFGGDDKDSDDTKQPTSSSSSSPLTKRASLKIPLRKTIKANLIRRK